MSLLGDVKVKLLFVHDTKFKEDKKGNYYTGSSYNMEVWKRYLSFADHLSVIARKEKTIYEVDYAQQNFNYFDKTKITFIETPDLKSSIRDFINIKKRKIRNEIIKKAVIDCDCLVARLPSSNGNIAISYAKKFKKPYLVEVVGCAWDALWNYNLKGKIIALPNYLAMKRSVKQAPFVIYVSNKFLQRRYRNDGISISCSDVELPPLEEEIMEKRIKKIKQMTENKPIILGTIAAVDVRYKGQQFVIKAISKLNKEGYNFEYHLVGGGDISYLKSVAKENNVSDKVKFLGSIPHEKVFEYLDNIDIYIQPSITEGLPRALVEAMSRGCPVIGSNVGGIPELVSTEFMFKRKDINDLIVKLKTMTKEKMLNEAKRNFEKAKAFDKKELDKRRTEFYKMFAESIGDSDD